MLAKRFAQKHEFQPDPVKGYRLLPFRFSRLDAGRYVLTNMAGEYSITDRQTVESLVTHQLERTSPIYDELKARHFLYDNDGSTAVDLLGLKFRTKHNRTAQFTGLHMFVVTLRCESSCIYCQVSRQTEDRTSYDMPEETARQAVEFAFQSPSPTLKFEFQGGEPLLNFGVVKEIVLYANELNRVHQRDLSFVIATNLTLLSDEVLEFCQQHDVFISTSLDGPEDLHNRNRPRPGKNSHALTVAGIRQVQQVLGRDRVSALMTTTADSLHRVRDIVDEYVRNDLHEIFFRPMSPYGFAAKGRHVDKYSARQWVDFYKAGLDYVLDLNRHGYPITEIYSSIILRKILTPQNPGYVDLQSPSGVAIAGIIYNFDGAVYASDESRMLAETGDTKFRLGNVWDEYVDVLGSEALLDTLEESLAESAPMCSDCAFLPYCGVDPIYHHQTQKDVVGNKATSGFCHRNMETFRYLLSKLEDSPEDREILLSWARAC